MPTRRSFLQSGVSAAAAAATMTTLPHALSGQLLYAGRTTHASDGPIADDPSIPAILQKGIDAATATGAEFVDIRLTHTCYREIAAGGIGSIFNTEAITVGVRSLVNGYWGFAAGPIWTANELVRLGQSSVAQAKANALGQERPVVFHSVPRIQDKQWTMPVKADPFEMDPMEVVDLLNSLGVFIERTPGWNRRDMRAQFTRQDKVYGSSDGSSWRQRTYRSSGGITFVRNWDDGYAMASVDLLSPAGEGWELFRDQPLRDAIRKQMEDVEADHLLPWIPVDVGRYNVILDAASMTGLISQSIGVATELDRALGYESNAGGTSYLDAPAEMLGAFQIGGPLLSVRGNRSDPGGAATVQWDDDGVTPQSFDLVRAGRLAGYATSRESAGWLKDIPNRDAAARSSDVRSNGCAYAPQGVDSPLVHAPNLVMTPGSTNDTLDTLTAGLEKGVLFTGMYSDLDFQLIAGMGRGTAYDVRNGKRVNRIANAGILFRTSELWNNITAICGAGSTRRFGYGNQKGEPPQMSYHSVTAVPVVIKDMTLIDVLRKA